MDLFEEARKLAGLPYISDLHFLPEEAKQKLLFQMSIFRTDPEWDELVHYIKGEIDVKRRDI